MLEMRGSILAILLLAGCVTGPAETIKPTPELVARQFEASAYGNDFGAGSPILLRWNAPLLFHFLNNSGYDIDQHKTELERIGRAIVLATKASGDMEPDITQANIKIAFIRRDQFAELIDYFPEKPASANEIAQTSACFGLIFNDKTSGVIKYAIVAIGTDIGDERQRDCIPEELVQIMGLPGDACFYRPSLICEGDRVSRMQPADTLMLAVLYDPALQSGMTKEQAMPIVRRLIRERWAEYMER